MYMVYHHACMGYGLARRLRLGARLISDVTWRRAAADKWPEVTGRITRRITWKW